MAVPNLSPYVYCAQFGEAADYWLSSPGTFYTMQPPYQCDKRWILVEPGDWKILMDGYNPPSDFYPDSTSLFYLFLVAVIAVYSLKSIVLRLFHAS